MRIEDLECGHTPPWKRTEPEAPTGWSLMADRTMIERVRLLPCPTCRVERLNRLIEDAPRWVNPMATEQPLDGDR